MFKLTDSLPEPGFELVGELQADEATDISYHGRRADIRMNLYAESVAVQPVLWLC
jgi:hypothetical protein